MEDKKTDMLTVEQYNGMPHKTSSNCVGFAIGIEDRIELDYWGGIDVGKSFVEKVTEYGLKVKQLQSLEELKGKTGFIVYGFYPMYDMFEGRYVKKDFHVVRVNPDGTLVHKQDALEPAKHVNLLDDRGGIPEYNAPEEPIRIFELQEERNLNREAILERINSIFERINGLFQGSKISAEEKEEMTVRLLPLKDAISDSTTVNSNEINITLQSISQIEKEYGKDRSEIEDPE